MSETPVAVPPAPSAPAAAAPSAPAPSAAPATPAAPVATPAAPATPSPAAPAAAAPAAPAPPAKYDPKTASAPPKSEDYPNTQEGLVEFARANSEWSMAHEAEAAKIREAKIAAEDGIEAAPATAPEAATTDAVKAAEGEKPAEPAKPAGEPVAAATPAVIEEWTGKSPELKAAFEKDPELKGRIMEMARQNEAAAPILEIVSTKEEAQFAVENANRLVTLQANYMLGAEDPEMLDTAWDQTVEMFKERDANGAEVKGPDGKPQLGADFKPFIRKAATTAMEEYTTGATAAIATLTAKLAGNYATDEARKTDEEALENAQYEKAAFDFVLGRIQATEGGPTALPALPPNATDEQKAFQKKLEDQARELDAKTGKNQTADRRAAGKALDREIQNYYEQGLSSYIETTVAAMKERGEYLPDFVINDKWVNPQTGKVTGLTSFAVKLYQSLNQKIMSNPLHAAKLRSLQAQGAAGKDARKAEIDRLRNLYLPKLFNAEVARIQDGIRATSKKPAAAAPATPGVARVEPQSVGTVVPEPVNARQWAEGEARKDPNWAAMSRTDQEALIMTLAARKKFGG